MIKKNKVLL